MTARSGSAGSDGPVLRESVLKSATAGDWATVDFVQDSETQSKRHLQGKSKHNLAGYKHEMEEVFSGSQGWLSAIVAGIVLGLIAVAIDICNHFVVDIRKGVCSGYFWLSMELCCPGSENGCPQFISWGEFFGGAQARHKDIVNFGAYVLIGTTLAAIAAVFCRFYAPFAAGGGINEVKTIVSGSVLRRYFSGWTMCIKAVAVTLSTGCGIQVGKEGPFVHIGACAADIVGQLFPEFQDDTRRRELISAGAAGGVAVAFGAPIGGVIFAVEEISSFYSFRMMMQALMCGVTAVLVVKNFDVMHTGRIVQFSISYRHAWKWFELPLYALIGVFAGLAGSLWNVCNMAWIRRRKTTWMKQYPITEVAVLGFVSCTFNFFVPFSKGGLLGLLATLFQDCEPGSELEVCNSNELYLVFWLIIAATIKMTLWCGSVGAMIPSGVLVPSLAIGAMYGRAFGILVGAVQRSMPNSYLFTECFGQNVCVVPGAYAIVGAAALLTGVTRMTVCLAVIMFELTGGLEYLVPVIIGILAAKATGDALGIESTYELGIEANNMPYLDPKKDFSHNSHAIDVLHHVNKQMQFVTLEAEGVTIGQLNNILEVHVFNGFPVVETTTSGATFLGYISRKALVTALQETAIAHTKNPRAVTTQSKISFRAPRERNDNSPAALTPTLLDFSRFVDSSSIQVPPECSTARLLYLFKSLGSRHVLVTSLSKFAGIITKKDFIKYMRDVEHEEHEAEKLLAAVHKKEH